MSVVEAQLIEAKLGVAKALGRLWDLEDRLQAQAPSTLKRGGQISPGRRLLNTVASRLSSAGLGGPDGTCLSWSGDYLSQFRGCERRFSYEFSATVSEFSPTKKRVVGDVKNLSHVPAGYFDLVLCTFVFEHTPQFWRAVPSLQRLLKPGRGVLIYSVPFVLEYHPHPGDFWRMTAQGVGYALESGGFDVCQGYSDGERAAVAQVLGMGELPLKYFRKRQGGLRQLTHGGNHRLSTSILVVAQHRAQPKHHHQKSFSSARCARVPRINASDLWEIDYGKLSSSVYWPKDVDSFAEMGRCFAGGEADALDTQRYDLRQTSTGPTLRERVCSWGCGE